MSTELINSKLNELNSIPGEESGKLYIPVPYALQEASVLYQDCLKDKEELTKARLDWNLAEDLIVKAGALQLIQSQWLSKYRNYEECQERWKEEAPFGYKFRYKLLPQKEKQGSE